MARKKVTSVPALADWGAVDNALRDIRERRKADYLRICRKFKYLSYC